MSNVKIDIVSEFKGKPAFDKASKSVSGLEAAVGKLAKQFLALYSTGKVISFAKESAKAFAADEKQAALLANTVKNLGLAFAAPDIERFVQKLQDATGVLDDQLRPAMQKLLTTTGSILKSQELLTQAIDISRGSGVELGTVVSDLSAAYVGNTRGLKKYALGLSQAELKAMSFTQIQQKLNDQFNGASQAYLQTYAGKLDLINAAASNAKETIGKSLFDALAAIAGTQGDVQGVADAFGNMATEVSNVITGIGKLATAIKSIPGLSAIGKILAFGYRTGPIGALSKLGSKNASNAIAPSSANTHLAELSAKAQATAKAKAEAAAAKRAKELAAAQTKQTKALKEQALLKKQSALFDLQQIQLVAALKGKLSDEDRNRVLLQLALLQGNEEEASRLSKIVANTIDSTGALAKLLTTLPDANNPFKGWDEWLKNFSNEMKATIALADATKPGVITDASAFANVIPFPVTDSAATARGGNITDASGFAGVIKVVIDGKEIAASLQNQSLSGNNTTVSRTSGNFNYL